jgi:hypothetical protein
MIQLNEQTTHRYNHYDEAQIYDRALRARQNSYSFNLDRAALGCGLIAGLFMAKRNKFWVGTALGVAAGFSFMLPLNKLLRRYRSRYHSIQGKNKISYNLT